MSDLVRNIQRMAQDLQPEFIRCRRYLHAHPELSFHEQETSRYLREYLTALEVPWRSCGQYGVIASLQGAKAGDRCILLRADMDALPILEKNQVEYASQNPGVMHACGHDGHTAMLLGVIQLLKKLKPAFTGTVQFLFQPAEERIPGGALEMIEQGALTHPQLQRVLGQHVMPALPAGKIALRPGLFTASADELQVTVHGRGGHAAQPHTVIDPLLIAAHVIIGLQQIVSRAANPVTPSVLSFGRCLADGTYNVIPDTVHMEGTFRTLDETWRQRAHDLMRQMADQIAQSMGGTCTFNIRRGYPSILNDARVYAEVKDWAKDYLGPQNVLEADPWMAAEDFAYYAQQKPGLFYLLGVGNADKGITSALHTPTFDLDEDALAVGAGLMTYLSIRSLGSDA